MKARHAGLPLLIVVASAWVPATVHAGPWMLKPNEYYTEIRGGRFSSDRIWDADRNSVNLSPIATVEERSIRSYTELGWLGWLNLGFNVPFVSRTIRQAQPHAHATETGLSDFTLGARIKLLEGPTAAALSLAWQAPLGYDRDVIPSIGRGTHDLIGALSLGTEFPALDTFVQIEGGYRHRIDDRIVKVKIVNSVQVGDDQPPAEILGRADVGVWATHALQLAGRYRGFIASDTQNDAEKRSSHAGGVQASYHTDPGFNIFAGWWHVFSGENTLDTDEIYVGFAFRHTSLNRLQGFLGSKQAR